ncbi:MAG: hypothetical protein GXO85_12330 [Chlorobi bacterium]|nr:hypothetical protein [Chlorobiota bacterium]
MERSKKTATLIVVIALIALTSSMFAQGYWCNDRDGYGMSWWNTNLPSQYQLSADQVVELNEYRTNFDQKIVPLQKELRALQIEMRGYVNRNNSDPVKVKEYRNQVRDIQDQIADIRIEARQKMNSIFTDEQQGYFNDTRVGWWDGFYGRCGWDYEDMMYDTDYGYNGRSGHRGNGCW